MRFRRKQFIQIHPRFKAEHISLALLKSHMERRFVAYIFYHVTEFLQFEPEAEAFGPDELIRNVRHIADAICGADYWRYAIDNNCVLIYRKNENDVVMKLIVDKKTVSC
jgi:hypothetical protein